MSGTLFGIGLGPGAPDLMTLRADRLIRAARVIAYPALEGGESLARSIAAAAIPQDVREIVVRVPMTTAREPAQAAYDAAAEEIAAVLEGGEDVVMLCEGDPLFYGSFMYLHARLEGRFGVSVVPGVTSLTACAAAAGQPLAARSEVLTVLPGTLATETLHDRIAGAEAVAIMKVGRHLPRIRGVIDDLGLSNRAIYVERASTAAERVLPLSEMRGDAPYFSMILITKGDDPWLKTR